MNAVTQAAVARRQASRTELAARIKAARGVSIANDPKRGYRAAARACRRSGSYARMFGIGKLQKVAA